VGKYVDVVVLLGCVFFGVLLGVVKLGACVRLFDGVGVVALVTSFVPFRRLFSAFFLAPYLFATFLRPF